MPNRRLIPGLLVLALAALALALPARPAGSPGSGEMLFFAMSIADERGAVLATPKLLGPDDGPVEMTMDMPPAEPGSVDEPRMSLWMQPERVQDGSYEICFEISMPGRVKKGKGKLKLRSGEEKKARVRYPGGHLDVQLAAFSVRSPEFRLYMQHAAGLAGPNRT